LRARRGDTIATTTFQKREKETKRRDKAREKEARREERVKDKGARTVGPDGVDPDLAGIVPGPQRNPLDDDDR
jgi:hypothetical protein